RGPELPEYSERPDISVGAYLQQSVGARIRDDAAAREGKNAVRIGVREAGHRIARIRIVVDFEVGQVRRRPNGTVGQESRHQTHAFVVIAKQLSKRRVTAKPDREVQVALP